MQLKQIVLPKYVSFARKLPTIHVCPYAEPKAVVFHMIGEFAHH